MHQEIAEGRGEDLKKKIQENLNKSPNETDLPLLITAALYRPETTMKSTELGHSLAEKAEAKKAEALSLS